MAQDPYAPLLSHEPGDTCQTHNLPANLYSVDHSKRICHKCYDSYQTDLIVPTTYQYDYQMRMNEKCPIHPNAGLSFLCLEDALLLCSNCRAFHPPAHTVVLINRKKDSFVDGRASVKGLPSPPPAADSGEEKKSAVDGLVDGQILCTRHQLPLAYYCPEHMMYICAECKELYHRDHNIEAEGPARRRSSMKTMKCERHNATKTMYCIDHMQFLCPACADQSHKNHNVVYSGYKQSNAKKEDMKLRSNDNLAEYECAEICCQACCMVACELLIRGICH